MLQGECALDAEDTVKLFTIDQVDQQKSEEWVYKVALQVITSCIALLNTTRQRSWQPVDVAAGQRLRSRCQSRTLQQSDRTSRSISSCVGNGMPSAGK